MKKVFLLATAFMMVSGVVLADNDKGKKKKKCAKGKYLLGDKISLADIALFDLFEHGLKALGGADGPFATSLTAHVKAEPGIAAYLNRKA